MTAYPTERYPKMKDSGVKWLGRVPEHWRVWRLKNVAEVHVSNVDKYSRESEIKVLLCNYVDVYRNDFIRTGLPFMRATATAREIERVGLRSGDVLITKDSEVWNDIGVPALVGEIDSGGVSGYHLALLRPDLARTHPGYLFRALQSAAVASQFHVHANGVTRFGLTHRAIKSVTLPVPPLSEQVAIARFLDHADRRIERCVRAKRKSIALLEEQERVLVHQVVTGQIDVRTGRPYSAYQPSRLSWAGDVPAHWAVASLRHRYSQCLGKMLDSSRITGDNLVPYLRNIDVQWDRINVDDLPAMDISPKEYDRYTVQGGDLLVCEGGEMGRCALWADDLPRCGVQKALHRLRPRSARRDLARFLYYALRCAGPSTTGSSAPSRT